MARWAAGFAGSPWPAGGAGPPGDALLQHRKQRRCFRTSHCSTTSEGGLYERQCCKACHCSAAGKVACVCGRTAAEAQGTVASLSLSISLSPSPAAAAAVAAVAAPFSACRCRALISCVRSSCCINACCAWGPQNDVLAAEAVRTHGKGRVFVAQAVKNTRQRQCLCHEGSGSARRGRCPHPTSGTKEMTSPV